MREYRARRKQTKIPAAPPEKPSPIAKTPAQAEDALEHRLHRQRADRRGWHNPYSDGLPDTPELIQKLSQKQRDAILARINHDRRAF